MPVEVSSADSHDAHLDSSSFVHRQDWDDLQLQSLCYYPWIQLLWALLKLFSFRRFRFTSLSFFPLHILKGNEKLLNMKHTDLLHVWCSADTPPWSFDPPPHHTPSPHFSHLVMPFISIKPLPNPVFQPKDLPCCNGGAQINVSLAL